MNGKKTHRFPLAVRVIIWLVIAGVLLYAGVMGFVVIREKGVANTVPSSDSYDAIIVLGAQVLPDGTETLNVIHLSPTGVFMEDSTCENHDCVEQGTVTFENRYERILSNMIICLPNQVILQLYDPDEVRALVDRGMPAP